MKRFKDFSNWRAVAHAYQGVQHLLYLGMSMEQVRKNYPGAFYDVLQADEQISITKISLEKWSGAPDSGRWVIHDSLKIPRIMKQKTEEVA